MKTDFTIWCGYKDLSNEHALPLYITLSKTGHRYPKSAFLGIFTYFKIISWLRWGRNIGVAVGFVRLTNSLGCSYTLRSPYTRIQQFRDQWVIGWVLIFIYRDNHFNNNYLKVLKWSVKFEVFVKIGLSRKLGRWLPYLKSLTNYY